MDSIARVCIIQLKTKLTKLLVSYDQNQFAGSKSTEVIEIAENFYLMKRDLDKKIIQLE